MANSDIRYKQTLDNSQFKKGLKDSQAITQKFSSQMKAVGGAIAGAFAVGEIINFSKESIKAYQDELRSEAKLVTALKGRQDIADNLIRQAKELQEVTLFDHDQISNAQAILALFVKEESQLKKLTPLVMDLAQVKNIDLASAAEAVGKGLMGQMRGLKSVGIELKYTGDRASMLTAITNELSKAVGGQAVAALTSEEKALRGATVAINEFKDAWGGILIAGSDKGGILGWITEQLKYFTWGLEEIKKKGGGFKQWWQWFWSGGAYSEENFEMSKNKGTPLVDALNKAMYGESAGGPDWTQKGLPGGGPVALMESVSEAAEETEIAVKRVIEKINQLASLTYKTPGQSIGTVELAGQNVDVFKSGGGIQLATQSIQSLDLAMRNSMEGMQTWKASYEKFSTDIAGISESIAEAIKQVAYVMMDAFSMMIEEIVSGTRGFSDIGNFLLMSIGNIMQELGKQILILSGFMKAFELALSSMQWYAAVAIGVGLIAAGSVLKGIAKRGMQPMASGGIVPEGFPGDTYPARLTSGEMVIPPHKLESVMGGRQIIVLDTRIDGNDIWLVQKKVESKMNRYR
jgi:hypothetical protein